VLDENERKLAYTINEACAAIGCKRSKLYQLIRNSQLDARCFGRLTLVTAASLCAYVENLPSRELIDIFERQGSAAPAVRGRGYKRATIKAAE
jgi:excisionase family DNA binding protein